MDGKCTPGEVGLAVAAPMRNDCELLQLNRRFYDPLWAHTRLVKPEKFNTCPLVQSLLPQSARRLEIAPGLRPRLPIAGTHFVDISVPALEKLRRHGADVIISSVTRLPYADGAFDLVCALDIVEHVNDDDSALTEIARVCSANGVVLLSAPLHQARWTAFDEFVGHRRRYDPSGLFAKLAERGLVISHSAVFGMRPSSTRLMGLAMWSLTYHRERAMWWYNHVFMPLALRFNK